jgi:DNA ligase 1
MTSLYKKDSQGRIRILNYWTKGAEFWQSSGLLDGELVENVKVCKSKNVGKTNETSPEEQAKLEMESKIREKLQEDYFMTVKEAENNIVILPMLAKDFSKYREKVDWDNAYVQPKLDGMRCLAHFNDQGIVTLLSRDGIDIWEKWKTTNHIIEALFGKFRNVILDGELYVHGDSFQDIMKKIKSYKKGESELIEYHVYDIVMDAEFGTRTLEVTNCVNTINNPCVVLVDTHSVFSQEQLNIHHSNFLNKGYEGTMVRWGKEKYRINARAISLLKHKDFRDIDVKIVDIVPAENRPEWGIVLCEYNGKQFKATPKIPHEDKIKMLKEKDKYIGKTAIITFFEFTDDGIPRFPIFKGVRLDNHV